MTNPTSSQNSPYKVKVEKGQKLIFGVLVVLSNKQALL